MTHGGERDTYKVFGYPKELKFEDYYEIYDRDEIGGAIADFIPNETWRNAPVLVDGDARSDEQEPASEFLRGWKLLNKRHHLITALNNADIYNAFSKYSVVFLGAPGNFGSPLTSLKPESLAYISVHNEGNAKVTEYENNTANPRFGLPTKYGITFYEGGSAVTVHWSRVIHLKEGNPGNRTDGTPRLKRIYNRLIDWEKVVGGASEAFWIMVNRGMAFIADQDADLPVEGTDEADEMDNQIEAFIHNLQRYMKLTGVEVKEFNSQVVDGAAQGGLLSKAISAGQRIPQRVLFGNEAGQLASTQDDENMDDHIQARQVRVAENGMLRPLIDRFLELGTLPQPANEYLVDWPPLFKMTEDQEVGLANKVLAMISQLTGGLVEDYIDMEKFVDIFYPRVAPTLREGEPPIRPDETDGEDGSTNPTSDTP